MLFSVTIRLRIIRESLYLVVRLEVSIVKEKPVKTKAISELEVIECAPLILSIETYLVELDACGRILRLR